MLEAFRRLPPVGRIITVALMLSVVAGLLALIPLALAQGTAGNNGRDKTYAGGTPSVSTSAPVDSTTGPVVARPQQTFTYTPDPKPTDVPQASNEPQKITTKLSPKVLTSAYHALELGVSAYCTYPKGEDNAQRAARLAPYFPENSSLASNNNDFITQQTCKVLNGYLQRTDGSNGITYNYYLSVATQYLQSDLSDNSAEADLKDYGYSVHANYIGGKWVIDKIDID